MDKEDLIKITKNQIEQLKPSATLAINEESNRLKKSGKKIYKFGFGQSPFKVPEEYLSIKISDLREKHGIQVLLGEEMEYVPIERVN